MIVVDNCIISSLSKIDRIDLLKSFKNLFTTPGVIEEALRSKDTKIIESISLALDDWLIVKQIKKPQKISDIQTKHPALSYIDCELILLCEEKKCILLTDDTKLISISENNFDIETFDLFEMLIALKNKKKLSSSEIDKIIRDLEKKDRYKFSKDRLKSLLDLYCYENPNFSSRKRVTEKEYDIIIIDYILINCRSPRQPAVDNGVYIISFTNNFTTWTTHPGLPSMLKKHSLFANLGTE